MNNFVQVSIDCETPQGFMFVKECPHCGTKYRFHGTTTERNDYYKFLENFSLALFLEESKKTPLL